MITEERGTKRGQSKGKKQSNVSWRDPWSRSMLSIILASSVAFITVVSKLSLLCSVIWDQSGGISSKQSWIRTFVMAQLDSLPTLSSHTPIERLQRKLRGWRCRLLSRWGLHHSIHTVSSIWEIFIGRCSTVAQTGPLCVWANFIPQSDLWKPFPLYVIDGFLTPLKAHVQFKLMMSSYVAYQLNFIVIL